jgi:hypothetical protein
MVDGVLAPKVMGDEEVVYGMQRDSASACA